MRSFSRRAAIRLLMYSEPLSAKAEDEEGEGLDEGL
jgi:hypothetical protein